MPIVPPTNSSNRADTTDPANLAAGLRAEASRLGFARVGITTAQAPPGHDRFRKWLAAGRAGVMTGWLARHEPLRADPASLLEGVRSIVMLASDYSTRPPLEPAAAADHAAPSGRGRVSRYAWGDDYHDLLRARVNSLAGWLTARVPGSRGRGVVDSAPLAERDFAWLAGLGWFGKNTMLISPTAGSFFFLSAMLTDVVLPADTPLETDHCGSCTACLEACPTGALVEPRLLDASRCISTLTIEDRGPITPELRRGLGEWVFGCDICQDVCPWNRHAPLVGESAFEPRLGEETLDLAELLSLDEAAFRRRFAGSPLVRAKRHGLARSAAIALGNVPHPPAAEALAAALADPEPAVRGAAAWALGRWITAGVRPGRAREALAARLATEADAIVRRELEQALQAHSPQVSSMSSSGMRPGKSSA